MGYYTHYHLEYENEPQPEIEEAKANLCDGYDPFDDSETKWYEHENDMRAFSKQFPKVLFTLQGNGESNEDMWYKYFKNGKMQVCPAKIDFDVFDPKKLK